MGLLHQLNDRDQKKPGFDSASAVILALAAVALFAWLGTRGLNEPDEGRYAEIGREMALQSNWLIPHLNGIEHVQKPPLTYWLTAFFIRWLGVNEWAVRMTPAIAAWGTIASVMFIAGRLCGPSTRWQAGLILLSSVEFFTMGRVITTDMLLTFWITTSIAGFIAYHTAPRQRFGLVLFYAAIGFGFLTKGPLAVLVPMTTAVGYRFGLRRAGQPLPRMGWLAGLAAALVLGLSWYVILFHAHPGLLDYLLDHEVRDRVMSDAHRRSKPFGFYLVVIAGGFLPWSIFLPVLLHKMWKQRHTANTSRVGLFAGWVMIPSLILLLARSKLATYVLFLFPPLSIAMAHGWEQLYGQKSWSIATRWVIGVFVMLFLALPVLVWQGHWVHNCALPSIPGIVVCVGGCAWLLYRLAVNVNSVTHQNHQLAALAGTSLLLLLFLFSQLDHFYLGANTPMKELAARIRTEEHGTPARVFMCDVRLNGMEFYLNRFVERTDASSDRILFSNPESLPHLVNEEDTSNHVNRLASQSAFIVLKERHYRADPVFQDWRVLLRSGACVLLAPPLGGGWNGLMRISITDARHR